MATESECLSILHYLGSVSLLKDCEWMLNRSCTEHTCVSIAGKTRYIARFPAISLLDTVSRRCVRGVGVSQGVVVVGDGVRFANEEVVTRTLVHAPSRIVCGY